MSHGRRRTKIILTDKQIPLVPEDKCWSNEGHVYAQFSAMTSSVTHMVGHLEDRSLTGTWDLRVIRPDYDEVPVEAVCREDTDPIEQVEV